MNAAVSKKRTFRTLYIFLAIVGVVILFSQFIIIHNDYARPASGMARTEVHMLMSVLDQYRKDVGDYPTTEQGLAALRSRPQGVRKWAGPYLTKEVPTDPWGRPWLYKYSSGMREPELLSYGADGKPGGTGEDADISSRMLP
jgi:general secretion pathway protein G